MPDQPDLDDFCENIQGLCTAASGADFSSDSTYRYALWRVWEQDSAGGNLALFGVNPSVANEWENDMTITKGCGFAKLWGHGGMYMFNMYGFVATNPLDMFQTTDPIGPRNDESIADYLANCNITRVVLACGSVPVRYRPRIAWQSRIATILRIINRPVYCLGRTKDGSPRHPSRIAYATPLELFWSPS